MTLTRTSFRQCGKVYTTREEAWRSKAGQRPEAEVKDCRCGGFHVTRPPKPAPRRRQPKDTGFTADTKLKCRKRAGTGEVANARCECCGCWLGRYGGEVQHRLSRGSGGSSNQVVSSLANAALMCGSAAARTGCHGEAESRDPEREMKARGFVIDHGNGPEFDPRYVSVMLSSQFGSGREVWLAEDGIGDDGNGYLFTSPLVGAAIASLTEDEAAELVPSLRKAVAP